MRMLIMAMLTILLLINANASAQYPVAEGTLFAALDEEGTEVWYLAPPPNEVVDAYVLVRWDALIGGAAYRLEPFVPLWWALLLEEFPGGIAIGSAYDDCGVEVGLINPGFGFGGTPVVISHIQVINFTNEVRCIDFDVVPHCRYDDAIVSDALGNLFSIMNLSTHCEKVDSKTSSWGSVKNLFR